MIEYATCNKYNNYKKQVLSKYKKQELSKLKHVFKIHKIRNIQIQTCIQNTRNKKQKIYKIIHVFKIQETTNKKYTK